jgi:hypothetical protein
MTTEISLSALKRCPMCHYNNMERRPERPQTPLQQQQDAVIIDNRPLHRKLGRDLTAVALGATLAFAALYPHLEQPGSPVTPPAPAGDVSGPGRGGQDGANGFGGGGTPGPGTGPGEGANGGKPGAGGDGQLGNGQPRPDATPVANLGLSPAKADQLETQATQAAIVIADLSKERDDANARAEQAQANAQGQIDAANARAVAAEGLNAQAAMLLTEVPGGKLPPCPGVPDSGSGNSGGNSGGNGGIEPNWQEIEATVNAEDTATAQAQKRP